MQYFFKHQKSVNIEGYIQTCIHLNKIRNEYFSTQSINLFTEKLRLYETGSSKVVKSFN